MDKYQFGNKLTEYRTQKGLTQSELGEILGVSNKAVSKWENGSAMPRLDMMSKITEYFGVSMDEFLDIPSDKKTTDGELEQKYLKLYNEKMRRRRINRICYFIIIPILLVFSVLYYIFGPFVTVRIKYNSLSEDAKHKPEQFQDYDLVFEKEEKPIQVGNVRLTIPDGFEMKSDRSEDEKIYYAPNYTYTVEGEEHSDIYSIYYSYHEEMEHYNYFVNGEGWCLENFGREVKTVYDTKWLFYHYDFSNIKPCDWKKAKMSQYIFLQGIASPINDRIIDYNSKTINGFIFVYTIGDNKQSYYAELYNEKGEEISVDYIDSNINDPFGYDEFCKVINSVEFVD